MAPVCRIPIPAGSLKVAFKGDSPKISGVSEESPMHGQFKIGYTFLALELGDGTIMQGLDTYELVAALNEHSDDPNRKMKMEMSLPAESTIILQPGAHGLIIEDKWGKAVLTRIQADSPLKKEIRVGMIVDEVRLADGYQISGFTAMEINEVLNSAIDTKNRTVILKSPASQLSARRGTLPSGKTIPIPSGTVDEIGLKISGNSLAKVSHIMPGSSLDGQARPGYAIESLIHPEGHVFTGLTSIEMKNLLNRTSSVSGRMIVLSNPKSMRTIQGATTKLMLPANGSLEDFGINVYGNPASIGKVDSRSPFQGFVFRGFRVQKCGWDDGTEFAGLDAIELQEIIGDSSGLSGRYIYLENSAAGAPNVVDVDLPAGKVGATFKGSPPKIVRMNADSVLAGQVNVGMTADTLTLDSGMTHYQMSTMEFTGALRSSANDQNRKIRFVQLEEVGLTPAPYAEITDEMNIMLPVGKLGVSFKGNRAPCVISRVNDSSPLAGRVAPGMGVDILSVNNRDYMELNATELAELIKSTADVPNRMIKVRDPSQIDEFSRLPDELELVLPPGKLGCTFTGKVPVAKSFRPDSPIAASYPPNMYVDRVVMPDGYTVSGLNTRELVNLLGQLSECEGRVLVLRNLKTTSPSPRNVIFPTELTTTLPTGKLGISFRGRQLARVSRLHEDSKLMGQCYVGMLIDSIVIPGGSTFSGMTAKEAARVLIDTKNVGGRMLIMKSPENSDISVRNILTDDASIGGSSQNMGDAFSTGSSVVSRRM